MTKQLLVYETAVPVNHARHGGWSVEVGGDYGFSRNLNSVPIMAAEFARAASEYPIVFAGTNEAFMPVVIVGMRGNENLYVNDQGKWLGRYIPAFIRRYPFVFASGDDGSTLTLCIDEAFTGFNQDGRGERMFDTEGKPTSYVQNVVRFLQGYQAEFERTRAFCKKLQTLDLLEPMQAEVTTDAGQFLTLAGFSALNRSRLKGLPGDTLLDMVKNDELELTFTHLHSLQNFDALKDRLATPSIATAALQEEAKGADE